MTHSAPARAALVFCAAIGLALLSSVVARADNPDAILGQWVTEGGKSHVLVTKVGSTYYGKIVWLKYPNYVPADQDTGGSDSDMTPEQFKAILGKPKVDRHNPDPKKRTHPVVGLQIFWDVKYNGDGVWEGGRVYDPEHGNDYHFKMSFDGPKLILNAGVSVFGRIMGKKTTWTRLPAPPPAPPKPKK